MPGTRQKSLLCGACILAGRDNQQHNKLYSVLEDVSAKRKKEKEKGVSATGKKIEQSKGSGSGFFG